MINLQPQPIDTSQFDDTLKHHLDRLRSQTIEKHSVATTSRWVEENTYINGRNFTFKNHEYQSIILSDTSREIVIQKCSQIGMSEATSRYALALTSVIPNYTTIYTLPTASNATVFMKNRIDPIINESAYLREMVHKTNDNTEVKQFGNSFLYLRGCQSNNAPISIPADHLIHDEVDFSSAEVISKYQSRLTHSDYKRKTLLSTPTFPDMGINERFKESRRHYNFVKCNHCNHQFVPNYFDHVKIPNYDGCLRELTKSKLRSLDFHKAKTLCPRCGKEPSLQIEHREYVCENPLDNYMAVGYQVSPFDAPNIHRSGIVTLESFLIESSVSYKKYTDFINFNLGLPAEDAESTVLTSDLDAILYRGETSNDGTYVFGLDMGLICYLTIAKVMEDGSLNVVHVEAIPVAMIQERRAELARMYWPRMTVADNLPYTETILQMQKSDVNMFGAWYVEQKSSEIYRIRDVEEDKEKGQQEVRQVNINRNTMFDALVADIRNGHIRKRSDENDDVWKDHLTDMKRAKHINRQGEESYVWKKSEKGDDHYHHSLGYAYVASKMIGVSHQQTPIRRLVGRFKQKNI